MGTAILALLLGLVPEAASQPHTSTPAQARTRALLAEVRQLPPESRAKVIAQLESALAQATPEAKPALEALLRQVKALDASPEANSPRTGLEQFKAMKPEQQAKVVASLEAEASKAEPATKGGYQTLLRALKRIQAGQGSGSSPRRIQSSLARYRRLDTEGRAKVLAQLQAEANQAEPSMRKTLEALITRLKAIPAS